MNSRIADYLNALEGRLAVPAERVALVVSELRSHVHDDLDDRMRAGIDEDRASEDAVAEMGDAEGVAGQFNQDYRKELGGAAMRRAIAAAQIVVVGVFAVMCGGLNGVTNILAAIGRATRLGLPPNETVLFAPVEGQPGAWLPNWEPGTWFDSWTHVVSFLHQHPAPVVLLELLLVMIAGLLAGYLVGRRGWAFGLIAVALPWMWVEASESLELTLLRIAAVVAGAELGSQLQQRGWRHWSLAAAAGVLGLAVVIGFVDTGLSEGFVKASIWWSIFIAAAVPIGLLVNLITQRWPAMRTCVSLRIERCHSSE